MKTSFETLIQLASYILNHLTEEKLVVYSPEARIDIVDKLATELGVSFAHDDDINEQAIDEVEEKLGEGVIDGDITETEVFGHAKREIIKRFNGENISGLYLMESINQIAVRINKFMLQNDSIDDVFGSDEEIVSFLVSKIRRFSIQRG